MAFSTRDLSRGDAADAEKAAPWSGPRAFRLV
jgi:hypothetical protein